MIDSTFVQLLVKERYRPLDPPLRLEVTCVPARQHQPHLPPCLELPGQLLLALLPLLLLRDLGLVRIEQMPVEPS